MPSKFPAKLTQSSAAHAYRYIPTSVIAVALPAAESANGEWKAGTAYRSFGSGRVDRAASRGSWRSLLPSMNHLIPFLFTVPYRSEVSCVRRKVSTCDHVTAPHRGSAERRRYKNPRQSIPYLDRALLGCLGDKAFLPRFRKEKSRKYKVRAALPSSPSPFVHRTKTWSV